MQVVPLDTEESELLVVRIGRGAFINNWTVFDLHVSMGTYSMGVEGRTKWTQTVDRTISTISFSDSFGFALGTLDLDGGENDNSSTNSSREQRDHFTLIIVIGVALVVAIAVAAAAIKKHHRLTNRAKSMSSMEFNTVREHQKAYAIQNIL